MNPLLDALCDEVRLGIVRHLSTRGDAGVDDLAHATGAHPNTVRSHLSALEASDVVESFSAGSGGRRGRPRLRYRLGADWSEAGSLPQVLAAIVARAGVDVATVREVSSGWGRDLRAHKGRADVSRELRRALDRLGFQSRAEEASIELSACPCPVVLPDRPELICELAVGACDGVLAAAGSDLRVGPRQHRPAKRRCSLALEPAGGGT